MGISVLPSRTTASVTRPENGSPDLLPNVLRVLSSFIFSGVPAGIVCATAAAISKRDTANTFFILPPDLLRMRRLYKEGGEGNNNRAGTCLRKTIRSAFPALRPEGPKAGLVRESR